jgi:hypothetical protein
MKLSAVTLALLLLALPAVGQTTSTTNCTSTATSSSTVDTNCSTQTQAPAQQPTNPSQGLNDALKQAQANAQARRTLKLQEEALKQQKQSQDRDFELQAITLLEKDRETFAELPATNDPLVTAGRSNLTENYNSVRSLACGTDVQLVIPDIDGTPNSCQKMQDAKILQSVAGACKDYAAKHPQKADGHEIKAWGNRHFTCVEHPDGTFTANEHP